MKSILILGIVTFGLMLNINCNPTDNSRILIVVEKGFGSVGFYTSDGDHIKSVQVDSLPHELRLSPDRKYAYITNNGSLRFTDSVDGGKCISVINLKTLDYAEDIFLTPYRRPHAIDVDSITGYLAVGVENPDKVLLIDPVKRTIVKSFDSYGKKPHMVTISREAKWIYVSNVQSANMVGINTSTGEHFTINVGNKPQGSVLTANEEILFVGCNDFISVINLKMRKVIAQIPYGANRMELIHQGKLLVFSSSKNGIGFANAETFEMIYHINIPYKPYSLHVSEDESIAYISAEEQDIIYQVNIAEKKIIKEIKLKKGARPDPVMDIVAPGFIKIPPQKTVNDLPNFKRVVIDSSFYKAYQIKTTDLNNDKKPDLIVVSDRLPEVVWYENPSWKKHILSNSTFRNIDIAAYDIDSDGDTDVALACRFNSNESDKGGYIYWLENPGNNICEFWTKFFIDSVPTTHRIKWASIQGERKKLISLPLMGFGAVKPNYNEPLNFYAYSIPENPKIQQWENEIIDSTLHMAHGLLVHRWDNDLVDDLLTASFEGVNLYQYKPKTTGKWKKTNLTIGLNVIDRYKGSSEIAIGYLGGFHKPFLATIEPWHGNELVYYSKDSENIWQRTVIDSSFNDGHALFCYDMNFDGYDEIIAGHRGENYNLYIYQFQIETKNWIRKALDLGTMSAAGVCVFDANNDGLPDIAACGSFTENVVLYINKGSVDND